MKYVRCSFSKIRYCLSHLRAFPDSPSFHFVYWHLTLPHFKWGTKLLTMSVNYCGSKHVHFVTALTQPPKYSYVEKVIKDLRPQIEFILSHIIMSAVKSSREQNNKCCGETTQTCLFYLWPVHQWRGLDSDTNFW